jgi:hypothetical protein
LTQMSNTHLPHLASSIDAIDATPKVTPGSPT